MLKRSLELLHGLQHPTGLFSAAKPSVNTGYHLAWMRDNVYITYGLEATKSIDRLKRTLWALLTLLLKHEPKIDRAIEEKPKESNHYIHARFHPHTMEELQEPWGNKQNDAIGALLFRIGDMESRGYRILRDHNDKRILQKLVHYLESVEYWHDKDNGMWEENEEVHASSVGACVAGLKAVKNLVHVPSASIRKGEETLKKLLPRESETKKADLALLSLIFPYKVVGHKMAMTIVKNVEENLLRQRGVIRYEGDAYYNKGGEAEWTKGISWLAIARKKLGDKKRYKEYQKRAFEVLNDQGEMPELYYANSDKHNENSPLGWSQSLFLVMLSLESQ